MNARQIVEDWWNSLSDEKRMDLLSEYNVPELMYKHIKEIYQLEVLDRN